MHTEVRAANLIGAAALYLTDAMRRSAQISSGLGGADPDALVMVAAEPGLSIQTVRMALDLSHPGAVRLVDRLQSRDLITREPGRGRAVALQPTRAGLAVRDRILAAREQAVVRALDGMTRADVAHVSTALSVMLTQRVTDNSQLRALCRLCDRTACEPCRPWAAINEFHA